MPTTLDRLSQWTRCRRADLVPTHRRFGQLLAACALPGGDMHYIKVTGTNGKGSVCNILGAGLSAVGRRVGVFTSPHLQHVTERIRINGHSIAMQDMQRHARTLEPVLHDAADASGPGCIPSFFEILLLIAVRAFAEARVQYAIIEAGIGGAHDATAGLPAPLSIITSVGLDHLDKLGPTLHAIARDKAGIADIGSTLVVGPTLSPAALRAVAAVARKRRVNMLVTPSHGPDAHALQIGATPRTRNTHQKRDRQGPAHSGHHQRPPRPAYHRHNVATAIRALNHLAGDDAFDVGIAAEAAADATLPGRFEQLGASPTWLLDGAHNPQALTVLVDALDACFPSCDRVGVIGVSRDHSCRPMADPLRRIAHGVYITDDFHNAHRADDVAHFMGRAPAARVWPHRLADLVAHAAAQENPRALIVVTGSLFLVGAVRGLLTDGRFAAPVTAAAIRSAR